MPRTVPALGAREAALPDLRYEVEMFHWLVSNPPAQGDRVRELQWMEGVLLHARNLIEFFGKPKDGFDTMHASDFDFQPAATAMPSKMEVIIHRALAHPSYSRAAWRATQLDSQGSIAWNGLWNFADFGFLWKQTLAFVAHVATSEKLLVAADERGHWQRLDRLLADPQEQTRLTILGTTTSLGEFPKGTIKIL